MATVHREMQAHLTAHRLALVELPRDHGKTTQAIFHRSTSLDSHRGPCT
jgi:hypothetical protein